MKSSILNLFPTVLSVNILFWTLCTITVPTLADEIPVETPYDTATYIKAQIAIDNGVKYLVSHQQKDGGWEAFGESHPAITALVLKSLVQHKDYTKDSPVIKRAVRYLLTFVQPDGGIYVPDSGHRSYHTSVALMALSRVNDPALKATISKAQNFLTTLQWDEGEDHDQGSVWYGGQGYGKHKRPDLSNTQLMLEALKQSGLSSDDPAYKKAMVFISRSQMRSESNDQPFARGADDGGFIYTPANNGESKAGTEITEGKPMLRSYGSMTYAGFKSMLYANVNRKDPRVRAAYEWIRAHYTLDANPNMPAKQSKEGLFYYYHTFARAMYAWGDKFIVDTKGKAHDWRVELAEKLITLQNEDGSWVNPEDRWYEGNPHLVTSYSILSLQTLKAK